MGQLTINSHFNSYVSLPEGNLLLAYFSPASQLLRESHQIPALRLGIRLRGGRVAFLNALHLALRRVMGSALPCLRWNSLW